MWITCPRLLQVKPSISWLQMWCCNDCTAIRVTVSDSDTPESRRRMLSDSDSDVSDIPPELPPRTPSRTMSNTVGAASSNGETRSSRTISIISNDNNLAALISDPWPNGTYSRCYEHWFLCLDRWVSCSALSRFPSVPVIDFLERYISKITIYMSSGKWNYHWGGQTMASEPHAARSVYAAFIHSRICTVPDVLE